MRAPHYIHDTIDHEFSLDGREGVIERIVSASIEFEWSAGGKPRICYDDKDHPGWPPELAIIAVTVHKVVDVTAGGDEIEKGKHARAVAERALGEKHRALVEEAIQSHLERLAER